MPTFSGYKDAPMAGFDERLETTDVYAFTPYFDKDEPEFPLLIEIDDVPSANSFAAGAGSLGVAPAGVPDLAQFLPYDTYG